MRCRCFVVIAALCGLIVLAPSPFAECAWVLWIVEIGRPVAAWSSKAECEASVEYRAARAYARG